MISDSKNEYVIRIQDASDTSMISDTDNEVSMWHSYFYSCQENAWWQKVFVIKNVYTVIIFSDVAVKTMLH